MSNQPEVLSLLAHKCAAKVLDLSTQLTHVSIRDQIIRAQMVSRDLCGADTKLDSVLVVGAGVAGASAAVALAARKKHVLLIDTNPVPFMLHAKADHRYISPYMYEWPSSFADVHDFPHPSWPISRKVKNNYQLQWSSKRPISGKRFALKMQIKLKRLALEPVLNRYLTIVTRVDEGLGKGEVQRFVSNPTSALHFEGIQWPCGTKRESFTIRPDYVVLAAGMGAERTELAPGISGPSFWEKDKLLSTTAATEQIGVFGGGDGALQDVLRALTARNHALDVVSLFPPSEQAMLQREYEHLLSIENLARIQSAWHTDDAPCKSLDEQCQVIARRLAGTGTMPKTVSTLIREGRGSVTLILRENYFSKSYLLNRFLVHLIEQSYEISPHEFVGKMGFRVWRETEVVNAVRSSKGPIEVRPCSSGFLATHWTPFDLIAVRYGINSAATAPKQLIGLSNEAIATRTSLSGIPIPLASPHSR